MPNNVKSGAFLLGEATLMMAPFGSTDVFAMDPATFSVGMVKNVMLSSTSDTIELRKGIQQLLVDSKKSNVKNTLSAEVFEFTAQNMLYAQSIGSQTPVAVKRGKLKNAANGAATTIVVNSDPLPGQAATGITAAADIPLGSTVLLQIPSSLGDNDYVLPVRTTAATTASGQDYTLTVAIPAGMTFPAGTKVWLVNEIGVGTTQEQEFFQLKIVGTMSANERPVTLIVPKCKVKAGFQLKFDEGSYQNMPFEFDPYFLSASEISGRLAEIGTNRQIHVLSA